MFRRFSDRRVMAPEGDGGGAGEGEKDKGEKNELALVKEQNAALIARLEKLEKMATKTKDEDDDTGADDDDLATKARKLREKDDKKSGDAKALESAIKFDLASKDFLKTNASLLPKGIADIFKAADAESFDSPIEKDRAIKEGLIKEFFAVQTNLDLLTQTQKNSLAEYFKLTKASREERAQSIYDSIFEPTIESLRRMKKAEALKKGFKDDGGSEDSYKQKMINLSKQHYLGEKPNA